MRAAMDARSPSVKVLAGSVILAALISLFCPSTISIKPIFLLTALGLALVGNPIDIELHWDRDAISDQSLYQ